jgi:hypothetical protein
MSSFEGDSGLTETYFKIPREVFVQHGLKKKKPLPNFAKVPPVGRIEVVFHPQF